MSAMTMSWLVLAALLLIGCAAPTMPTPPADLVIVIPTGTASARMRGESVVAIPQRMTLTAGQSVVVRNQDTAMHYFFYAPIAPGQTFRKTFDRPGMFGYSGFLSCSVADFDAIVVEVTPPAARR